MARLLTALGLMSLVATAACAPNMDAADGGMSRFAASGRSLSATDAVDPMGAGAAHEVIDIWGHRTLAPGAVMDHGGSSTDSLGVSPPGSGGNNGG